MRSLNASNWLDAWLALTTSVFYLFLHTFSLSFYPTYLPFTPFVRNELWRVQRRPQTKRQTLNCCATLSSICFVLLSHSSSVSLSLSLSLQSIISVQSAPYVGQIYIEPCAGLPSIFAQYNFRKETRQGKFLSASLSLSVTLSFALALHAYLMWRFVYSVA